MICWSSFTVQCACNRRHTVILYHSSPYEVERTQGPSQVYVVYLQREQYGKHVLVFMIDAEFLSY
jgi:hypothetical protein